MQNFPPFRFDKVNECLWRDGASGEEERIHLTPKAFAILQCLVDNANRLVPYQELIDSVWPNTFIQPELLSSHIREIRSVLGDDAKKPRFIETQARRGYRFIAKVTDGRGTTSEQSFDIHPKKLVGRDSPLSTLHDCLSAAMGGQRQVVFITGEPGIGKTAVCLQFLEQIQASGKYLHSAWGQCIEGYGGKEPYSPMLKAIAELCRTGGDSIVRILTLKAPTCVVQFSNLLKPEHREALEREVKGATSGRMLREVLDALEAIAIDRPLVLFLEDLQWVDLATIDVIAEFARRRQTARVLLIATYRPLEVLISENPIRSLKEELLAHRLCREIALEPLSKSDVAEYLSDFCADPDLSRNLANVLYQRSEGNPLFMVAALDHSFEQGLMFQENGHLRLRTPLAQMDLDIPQSLRKMVEAQISRLGETEQRVLEAASVAGVIFSSTVAAAGTDYDRLQVEDVCHTLANGNHIVRPAGFQQFADGSFSSQYEFVHVLYRDVLYDRQAPGRRSARHQLIGDELETLYKNHWEEIAGELAHHFELASDWIRTIKYLDVAAETAERRYAHRESAALRSRALDLISQVPEEQRMVLEIRMLQRLAMIYVASFDSRYVEIYERLAARASVYGLIEVQVQALLDLAACLSWVSAERCLEVAERGSQLTAGLADPTMRARMRMSWFFWRVWSGGWNTQDVDEVKHTLEALRKSCERHVLAPHLIDYCTIQWASSAYRESHDSLVEGLKTLKESAGEQNPYLSIAYQKSQYYLPRGLLFLGQWGDALREVDASIASADKNGDYFPAQLLRLTRAWIHLHALDFASVLSACEITPRTSANFAGSYLLRFSLLLAGSAEVGMGNYDQAFKTLSAAQDEMDRQAIVLDWYFRMPLELAFTELWLKMGDLIRAREVADRLLARTLSTAERTWQALAWEINGRLAIAEGRPEDAEKALLNALETIADREIPLASWRVHASAASFYEHVGNPQLRHHHRGIAREAVLELANSLGPERRMKTTFLSAPIVSGVLEEKDTIHIG